MGNSSKYTYVYKLSHERKKSTWMFSGCVDGNKKAFKTEIEAAKWVDMQLIRAGKDPVNFFKKK